MPIPTMDVTVYGQLRAATGEKTIHIEGDVETVARVLRGLPQPGGATTARPARLARVRGKPRNSTHRALLEQDMAS